jgi:hypothetical protein
MDSWGPESEPECPWEAIALDDDVPLAFADDIALNAITAARPTEFVSAAIRTRPKPTAEQVEDNRRRWETASELTTQGATAMTDR